MNVIVTGASKGIGRAVAEAFAGDGHHLFLCARTEKQLFKTVLEIEKLNPAASIAAHICDLSDANAAKDFGAWCLEKGTPDILVNNAGMFEPGSVYNEPEGTLESQIATNLYSAYHLTRSILPAMMERKIGHIFNICSIASLQAYKNGGAYSISKFALNGFSKNLREEMKPFGIKVTAVFPGAVMTDSWKGFDNSKGRIMVASDIAQMILAASKLSPQACVEEIVIRPQAGDL